MSDNQSITFVAESLSSGRPPLRNEPADLANVALMSPVEEMKLIERIAQAMPDEQDHSPVGLRRFSKIKEFSVEEWLERSEK